jgi:DNA-binding NarL/FixJ family response regulator
MDAIARELHALTELGTSCTSRSEFRRDAVLRLSRTVGFDVAFAGTVAVLDPEPLLFDVQPSCWRAFVQRGPELLAELAPLAAAAHASGGVALDTDVLDARSRERLAFYRHCVHPNRSRAFLAVHLSLGGQETTVLHLGRTGPRRFGDRETALVRRFVPALSLGDGLHAARDVRDERRASDEASARLTPREREVIEYVALGLTNREVALACGTSVNTVRNQLASIFGKLGVASRTELTRVVLLGSSENGMVRMHHGGGARRGST